MRNNMATIGLNMPKNNMNVGSVLRAAGCFGAELVVTTGRRYRKACTDTMKAHKNIPLLRLEDIFDGVPYDCVPVAVDLVECATNIVSYVHPRRAFYIFGSEDGTLGPNIIDRCRDVIYIPSAACLNLAMCVNVVLFDRMSKEMQL